MNAHEIDWKAGRVTFWDLDVISDEHPLAKQVDNLKEDLAQVEYAPNVVLDVGWYPQFAEDGRFVVIVVLDQRWDEPVYRNECQSVKALVDGLLRAIDLADAAATRIDAWRPFE